MSARTWMFHDIGDDVRHALRTLVRTPVFSGVAVLTLALGVGVNASTFALLNEALLRPLPYAEPERLVSLFQTRTAEGESGFPMRFSYREFDALRNTTASIEPLAAYFADDVNLAGAGEPVRARAEFVSASYFPVLRVTPVHGRGFIVEDERNGAPVVVLAHELWTAQFGAQASILGRTVRVNGVPVIVAGITAPGFRGLTRTADLWILHALAPQVYMAGYLVSDERFFTVVGRLAPGATALQAQAELSGRGKAALAGVRSASGDPDEWQPGLMPLDAARRNPVRMRAQFALAAGALGVLLIASLNLSGLLLARAVARRRESAIRCALGAGRLRLMRSAFTEATLLGLAGGILGLLLGMWCVRALATLSPQTVEGVPILGSVSTAMDAHIDWRVALFTLALALLAAMLAAAGATLRSLSIDLGRSLRYGARGSTVHVGTLRKPTLLTVATIMQVACSMLLLTGAALLTDGLQRLRSMDAGFDAHDVLAFRIAPPNLQYGRDAAAPLLSRVLDEVRAVPGVRSATVSLCAPLSQCSWTPLYIEGREIDPPGQVGRHYVGEEHFRTLGIPLLRGRGLTAQDRAGSPRVAVINETAARRFWPDTDPVGQRVWFGSGGGFASPDSLTEIVGIVGDVLYGVPGEEIRPDFYTSFRQFTWPATTVMVRAGTDPAALVPAMRRAVAAVDPNIAVHDVQLLAGRQDAVLAEQRLATIAIGVIAALGLMLACLGVYGIMAWSVAQRRREIGIRAALGATSSRIARLVLTQGWMLVFAGVAIGIAASLALGRTMRAMLPHAAPVDILHIAAVCALLLLVATLSCWLPARLAGRVDPLTTVSEDG